MYLNINDLSMILLAIVIPLSAASFWPLAHISAFNLREEAKSLPKEKRTFDLELAVLLTGILIAIFDHPDSGYFVIWCVFCSYLHFGNCRIGINLPGRCAQCFE
jgi:hypothetical protein